MHKNARPHLLIVPVVNFGIRKQFDKKTNLLKTLLLFLKNIFYGELDKYNLPTSINSSLFVPVKGSNREPYFLQ